MNSHEKGEKVGDEKRANKKRIGKEGGKIAAKNPMEKGETTHEGVGAKTEETNAPTKSQ